jgi:hypothetical protein
MRVELQRRVYPTCRRLSAENTPALRKHYQPTEKTQKYLPVRGPGQTPQSEFSMARVLGNRRSVILVNPIAASFPDYVRWCMVRCVGSFSPRGLSDFRRAGNRGRSFYCLRRIAASRVSIARTGLGERSDFRAVAAPSPLDVDGSADRTLSRANGQTMLTMDDFRRFRLLQWTHRQNSK